MLMLSMGAFADAAQAVECRNPKRSREISIRASANRSLLQSPAQFCGDFDRLLVKRSHASRSLHRRTIDATANFHAALLVEGTHRPQLVVNARAIGIAGDSNINQGLRAARNYVHLRSPAYHADIQRESVRWVHEIRNGVNLPRQFENRALAFIEVEPGVRCLAGDADRVPAHTLARGLNRPMQSVSGLENKNR